jgi:predicted transcriptional regulator
VPKSLHDPAYKDMITRLASARVDAGLTQQGVAARLGLPQSYVAKIEGGERRIDVIEFLRLAKALGVDPMPMIRAVWVKVRES